MTFQRPENICIKIILFILKQNKNIIIGYTFQMKASFNSKAQRGIQN